MNKPKYYLDNVKEVGKGFVVVEQKIELPKGKTTTKGDHTKLNNDASCAYPERASCNYGLFFERCEYMKYDNSGFGHWVCQYKK